MFKNLSLIPVALLASTMAFAGPQGFDNKLSNVNRNINENAPITNDSAIGTNTNNIKAMKISDINNLELGGNLVLVRGRITGFIGDDKYNFMDDTGSLVLELDDDKPWSHIAKDQLIEVVGKTQKHIDYTIIKVINATALER